MSSVGVCAVPPPPPSFSVTSAVIVPFEIPLNGDKRERSLRLLLLAAYLVSQAFPRRRLRAGCKHRPEYKRSAPSVIKKNGWECEREKKGEFEGEGKRRDINTPSG